MSCIYKRGDDCFLFFYGIGMPDTCRGEDCPLWEDEYEDEDEDKENEQ